MDKTTEARRQNATARFAERLAGAYREHGKPIHATVAEIRAAMLDLRRVTAEEYAQAVKAGLFQLQRITYDAKGRSTVERLTDWRDADTHLADLRARAAR